MTLANPAIDAFQVFGGFFPGVAVANQFSARVDHGLAARAGLGELCGRLDKDGHIAVVDDDAALMFAKFVEVAFGGDDGRAAGGEGFGDGHGEAFLVGRAVPSSESTRASHLLGPLSWPTRRI